MTYQNNTEGDGIMIDIPLSNIHAVPNQGHLSNSRPRKRKSLVLLLASLIVIVVLVGFIRSPKAAEDRSSVGRQNDNEYRIRFSTLVESWGYTKRETLTESHSPASHALEWLSSQDSVADNAQSRTKFALATIYHSTSHGKNNRDRQGTWLTDFPVCRWEGIECDQSGSVIGMNMSHNELVGQLPAEINLLSGCEVLDVSHNALTGTLPDMSALSGLRRLRLGNNQYEAQNIPESIFSMVNLQ